MESHCIGVTITLYGTILRPFRKFGVRGLAWHEYVETDSLVRAVDLPEIDLLWFTDCKQIDKIVEFGLLSLK